MLFINAIKLISSKKCGPVTLNPYLMLLLAEVNLILEEQSYKKNVFIVFSSSDLEIVLALLTKRKIFHIQVPKI